MKSLQINYLAVLTAAVATFILGAIWYIGFSVPWMELTSLTEEKIATSGGGASSFIISFTTYLLAAYAMAIIFKSMNISTIKTGTMTGALIGALIVGGNIFTNNACEMKPLGLSILNAGFSAVSGAVVGAILGGWKKYV